MQFEQLKIGNKINRTTRKPSTAIKTQNKMVLPVGFSQRKYSTKSVNNKYSKPKPTKKINPAYEFIGVILFDKSFQFVVNERFSFQFDGLLYITDKSTNLYELQNVKKNS